ncbi:glycosyltransferase family 2 protein [Microbacterium sp. ET2]|uniref:glycosyltransferase family 2 protein n=1 Tax=Microbacterium albipurpureum TaxID=3050384 RepID=UPI00259C8787|nr:glycosyltransferase family 2 protein [Microbacterium sp. ET2 (Ac-2212)]WJL96866.1 glycosyltransferase family 2 protein [Microbacterium sp. ET2 (Ac-2212)]
MAHPNPPRRISVVIPVKDDADELRHALTALADQTVPPDEVVVLDNGSDDHVEAVAREAGARLVREPGGGIPRANAAAFDAATGDIIARMDADCRPGREWVAGIVRAFDAQPEVAAVTGGGRFVDGPPWLRRPLAAVYLFAYSASLWPALGHAPLWGSNLAVRREAWQRVAPLVHRDDPDVHDDLDLAFHLGERHRIRLVPGLPMGMSMRPFADASAMRRRFRRGIHTVLIHWPRDVPPVRIVRLTLARATGRTFPGSTRMSTGSTGARESETVDGMSDATASQPSDPTDAADGAQTHEPTPETDDTDTVAVDDGDSLRDRSDLQDLPPVDAKK